MKSSSHVARRSLRGGDEDDTDINASNRPLSAAATRAVAAARARAASLQHSLQRHGQRECASSESPPSPSPPPSPPDTSVGGSCASSFSLPPAIASRESSMESDLGNPLLSLPSKPETTRSGDETNMPPIAGEDEESSDTTEHSHDESEPETSLSHPETSESPSSGESISHLLSNEEPSPSTASDRESAPLPSGSLKDSVSEKPERRPRSPPQCPKKLATVSDDFSPVPMPLLQVCAKDNDGTPRNDALEPDVQENAQSAANGGEETTVADQVAKESSSEGAPTAAGAPINANNIKVEEIAADIEEEGAGTVPGSEEIESSDMSKTTKAKMSHVAPSAEKATKPNDACATISDESSMDDEKGKRLLDPTELDSSDGSEESPNLLNGDKSLDYISYESDDPAVADVGAGEAAELLHDMDRKGGATRGKSEDGSESSSEYLPTKYTPPRLSIRKYLKRKDAETKKATGAPISPAATEVTLQSEDDRTVVSAKTISSATTLPRSNGFNNTALARIEPIDSRETGIGKGDIVLSILSMPKKKQQSRRQSEGSKDQCDSDMVQWCQKSVKDATWRSKNLQFKMEEAGVSKSGTNLVTDKPKTKNGSSPSKAVDVGVVSDSRPPQEIALELTKKNKLAEALEMYVEILSSYQATLARQRRIEGRKHPSKSKNQELEYHPCIGTVLFNIGVVHMLNASYDDALQTFKKSAQIRKECLGESADYFASLVKQGICHYALGQFSAAEMAFEEALMSGPRASPSDRAQVAEVYNNLACIQFVAGLRDTALQTFQESLSVNSSALSESLYGGVEGSSQAIMAKIAATRINIGLIFLKAKKYEFAVSEFEGALMRQMLLFKPSDPFVLATMDKLAFTNVKKGDLNKALKMYNRMLESQIEALGPHHIDCAQTLTKIGLVHMEEKNYKNALSSIDKVIEAESNNGNRNLSGRFKKLSNVARHTKKKMSTAMGEARKSSRRMGERQKSAKG